MLNDIEVNFLRYKETLNELKPRILSDDEEILKNRIYIEKKIINKVNKFKRMRFIKNTLYSLLQKMWYKKCDIKYRMWISGKIYRIK